MLCSTVTRQYLINYARTLIYTTALSFPSLASVKVTYDFLASGRADALRSHLRRLTAYTHDLLLSLSKRHQGISELLCVDSSAPRAPIIPLLTPRPRSLAQHCQQRGLIVRPIAAPTVPKGRERVRVCLHAANNRVQVEELAMAVEEWLQMQTQDARGPVTPMRNESKL